MSNTYYKGDDWNAFGQEWVKIYFNIPENWTVTKAEFKVGNLPVMTFNSPVSPLTVSLDSSQTKNLKDVNTCYLALYDENGRKQTLDGSWTFVVKEEKVQ